MSGPIPPEVRLVESAGRSVVMKIRFHLGLFARLANLACPWFWSQVRVSSAQVQEEQDHHAKEQGSVDLM